MAIITIRLLFGVLFIATPLLLTNPRPTFGEADPAIACNDHQALFKAIKAARSELRSGIVRGKGYRILRDNTEDLAAGDLSFQLAFDYDNERVRWERIEPFIEGDPRGRYFSVQFQGYRLLQTPQILLFEETMWPDASPRWHVLNIAPSDFTPPPFGRPIDVRTFGLNGWMAVTHGSKLEELLKDIDSLNVTETHEGANGRCVVEARPHELVRCKLWINRDRGFTVERDEVRILDSESGEWGDVTQSSQVKWTEQNGAWVPTSLHLEKRDEAWQIYHADLEWEQVNEVLPEENFRPSFFGRDTVFIDRRGEKSVGLGRLQDPDSLLTPRSPSAPAKD